MDMETDCESIGRLAASALSGEIAGCQVSVFFSGADNKDAFDEAIRLLATAFSRSEEGLLCEK